MYLEGFKTEIDEKRALESATELSRILTTLMPSIALTEILLSFDVGVEACVFLYSRVPTTNTHRASLRSLVFGSGPVVMGCGNTSYSIIVESRDGRITTEELSAPCSDYPWFAPVELAVLAKPLEHVDQTLSIRVPSLLTGERLSVTRPDGEELLPRVPHLSDKYVGE